MNIAQVLTQEQLEALTQRSDWRAAWMVTFQWLSVITIFAVVAYWTHPLTILAGIILLGGRQLGFGILVHECGHRTLFKSQRLNDSVGIWVVSPPTFNNMRAYMRGHLKHHRDAGTQDDPDLANYRDYPISRERLRRKLKRDLTGQTGWRTLKGIGKGLISLNTLKPETRACLVRGAGMNLMMLATLVAVGEGWLYLMWVAAFVFANPMISRVRQVAEHAAVPDLYDLDPRKNTRTLLANPLVRAIFCPHGVNYHLEHHLAASVPIYRLPAMHAMLRENGFYEGVEFPHGYINLLRRITRPTQQPVAV
jgi:fatty acid desaturase